MRSPKPWAVDLLWLPSDEGGVAQCLFTHTVTAECITHSTVYSSLVILFTEIGPSVTDSQSQADWLGKYRDNQN